MTSIDTNLSLLACQIAIPATRTARERDIHLLSTGEKVANQILHGGIDLVVLPELSSIEYSRLSFEKLDALAEPIDGPSFEHWRWFAKQHSCHVVYGFPRKEHGQFFITIAAVCPDGNLIGHYDKMHLAQFGASMEKEYFTRGRKIFVFEIKGVRVAPIICYDIRFPELSRTLALEHKTDLILHCGAYARDESFATWHSFAITRALENQVFFLSLNRAGEDYGSSLFCWPWVDNDTPPVSFSQHSEEFKKIQVDRQSLIQTREKYSFLADKLSTYSGRRTLAD